MPRRLLAYKTPNSISGLVAWLKADAISASDGDPVSSWADSSGNSNTPTQSVTTSKPTYKSNVVNGLPVVRFNGANNLTFPTASHFDLPTPSIFVVFKRNAGGSGSLVAKTTTSFTDGRRRKMQVTTGSNSISYNSGSDSQGISTSATPTNWNMFGITTVSDSSHSMFSNAVQTDTTTPLADSTLNTAAMEIGTAFGNGAEAFNGDIAEIIIYNRALAKFEVVGLQNYLATKYNITVTDALGGYPRNPVSGRKLLSSYRSAVRIEGSVGASVTWTNTPFNSPSVVTACVWVKLRSGTSTNFDVPFGFGNTRWFFIFNSTTQIPGFNIKVSGVEKLSGYISNPLIQNQFYLLCGTYDPSGGSNNLTIRVYDEQGNLYGSSSSTQTGSMDAAAVPLTLGRDPVRAYNMTIDADEVHVYSRILTANEQRNIAISTEPSATNLELWARCNETSGNLADASGNSRTGTNSNCTFVTSFNQGRNLVGSGVAP